jgi:hypothetical protein
VKRTVLICIFLSIFINGFSQEMIWSTVQNDVRTEDQLKNRTNVRNLVLELYDNYNYYYDDTGYDMDYFLQAFGMDFMLAHLPKSAMAMQMNKNGYTQIQVLIFILYQNTRISGCLIFSDDGRGGNAIATSEKNRTKFESLLDSLWVAIDYYPDEN